MTNNTVKELKKIAKERCLKGYSKLKKAELEELLREPESEEIFLAELDPEVEVIQYKNDNDWLETRKLGIGGSDISGILGINRYRSPADIWADKMGQGEKISNRFTYFGHKLEPVVADVFEEKHNLYEVKELHRTLKRGRALANIDRLIMDKDSKEYGVLEIKTANAFKNKEWSGDEVPSEYYAQVQLYLAVTGLKFAYIACLIGGNDYKEFYIERSNEECEFILSHCEWWWREYVEAQVPPPPSGDNAYTEYQKKKIELLDNISIEIEEDNTIQTYEEIIEKIDELEKEKKRIQQVWIDKMIEKGANKATIGTYKITTVTQQREIFDKKKFKENIENADEYFAVKETKFFKVTKTEGEK